MDDQRRLFLAGGAAMTMGTSLTPLLVGCGGSDTGVTTSLGAKPPSLGLGGTYMGEIVPDFLYGSVALFAFSGFVPGGWQICDGQLVSINQYPALYSLLQNRFGGDGVTTFALPKLQVPEALNPSGKLRYLIALNSGIYPPHS